MILGFIDGDTERLWNGQRSRRLSPSLQDAARRKLRTLDAADQLEDLLNPPGNRLEKLRGARAGQYSIRINDQWRICFRWRQGGPIDVEIVDYH
ncbi:MAG: type II toxin-antitoxin system RelE/ParE family toxin [Rhizobiales bacterium]|nr:type II toxin-antitoxin system RelE/ParE family toxin [Hyphomicrobiales bacterium]MDQ3561149.1 type II toxin-antitoxin system RelE/ParE family toxin [Pseudomonadota bacterium]